MDPKKTKELITEFCELKGYDESIIQIVIDECYGEIRKCSEEMLYDHLELPGIGDMFLKAWSVNRQQKKFQSLLDTNYLLERDRPIYEKLTIAYNRMSSSFYKETNKSIDRMMAHSEHTHKHDYSNIEGHEYRTIKPGTYCYHLGCRCDTCKACASLYRKAYNERRKRDDTEREV